MKLVRVDWIDSAGATAHWQELEDIRHDTVPCRCQSVGWIVHEDKAGITLAPHVGTASAKGRIPDQACGVMTIPKCAIKKRKVLK